MSLALLATSGCGNTVIVEQWPGAEPLGCQELLDGECVGVGTAEEDLLPPCPCNGSPVTVSNAGELASALGNAGCIALNDGHYEHVELRDGVQIVGASVAGVVVAGLTFPAGADASACRLTVAGPVKIASSDAYLQYALITGNSEDAVSIDPGGALRLAGSTITATSRYAVSAFDGGTLELDRSAIAENAGPGIWMQCNANCYCGPSSPRLTVHNSVLRANAIVGISMRGVEAEIHGARIADTTVGPNFESGGGIAISGCSDVTATGLLVEDNADFGMLVEDSRATLGGPGEGEGIVIERNLRGIWLQNLSTMADHSVHIDGASLTANGGIGIGMDGSLGMSRVSISNTTIDDTEGVALPYLVGGVSAGIVCIGDAVQWLYGVEAQLDNVSTSGSGRVGLLIDGPANGVLKDVTLAGSDQLGGIVQVNYFGGAQPDVTGTTPPIQATQNEEPSGGFPGSDCQ